MNCSHFEMVEGSMIPRTCTTLASRRSGRRLYCEEHAPEGSVDLDRFVSNSQMSERDKAAVYDEIAAYLRKAGWRVSSEYRDPSREDGVRQVWTHDAPSVATGTHGLLSAYRIECYLDAPAQGARLSESLRQLTAVIDAKKTS